MHDQIRTDAHPESRVLAKKIVTVDFTGVASFAHVPTELKRIPHWCLYKNENDRKIPYLPDGTRAASNAPATWASFNQVLDAGSVYAGPGFFLGEGAGLVFVDLDDCVQGNEIKPWAREIIERLNSYTEFSPSGTGVHILAHGKLPLAGNRVGSVEMYEKSRYLTVTGKQLSGTPRTINDADVAWLHKKMMAREYEFNKSEKGNSQSERDLAFCIELARRLKNDTEAIDREFRLSELMRDKWDEIHDSAGRTYGQRTIAKAIELRTTKKDHSSTGEVNPDSWPELFHDPDSILNLPPPVWLINHLVQEEEVTFFAGLSGHSKTWIMLAVAKALLTGEPLFAFPEFSVAKPAQRVIYLIPEVGARSFGKRLKLFKLDRFVREEKLFVRTLSMKGRFPDLSDPRIFKAANGAHVFLDTAIRFMEGDENSSSEASKHLAQDIFDLLSAGAISIFGAHHSPKGFRKEYVMNLENALRGSGDIGAMLFNAYGVKKLDENRNLIQVECLKGRDLNTTPQPFQIEGRPWIDKEGNFRLVKPPGECGILSEEQ